MATIAHSTKKTVDLKKSDSPSHAFRDAYERSSVKDSRYDYKTSKDSFDKGSSDSLIEMSSVTLVNDESSKSVHYDPLVSLLEASVILHRMESDSSNMEEAISAIQQEQAKTRIVQETPIVEKVKEESDVVTISREEYRRMVETSRVRYHPYDPKKPSYHEGYFPTERREPAYGGYSKYPMPSGIMTNGRQIMVPRPPVESRFYQLKPEPEVKRVRYVDPETGKQIYVQERAVARQPSRTEPGAISVEPGYRAPSTERVAPPPPITKTPSSSSGKAPKDYSYLKYISYTPRQRSTVSVMNSQKAQASKQAKQSKPEPRREPKGQPHRTPDQYVQIAPRPSSDPYMQISRAQAEQYHLQMTSRQQAELYYGQHRIGMAPPPDNLSRMPSHIPSIEMYRDPSQK